MSATRYSPRFELPDLIERGRAETIACPVYRDGQLAAPTAMGSTVSVYDADGTAIVSAQAVTVTSGIATFVVPALTTSPLDLEADWRVEWSLVMPDGVVHLFRNDAALVKYRLYPTIADLDVSRRLRALDPSLPAVIHSRTNFQDAIDEADTELQLRLLEDERRPNLIATPSALRMTWLHLTITIVLEGLAVQNPEAYAEAAKAARDRYEAAFGRASAKFDWDEDGVIDAPAERIGLKPGAIWTC